jgi:hypothetical protein
MWDGFFLFDCLSGIGRGTIRVMEESDQYLTCLFLCTTNNLHDLTGDQGLTYLVVGEGELVE